MAEGPVIENTGHIDGVTDIGNQKGVSYESTVVRCKPNDISGDPVNDRKGDVYGGAGGVDAR